MSQRGFKRSRSSSFGSFSAFGSQTTAGINSQGANGGRSRMPRKVVGFGKGRVKIGKKMTAATVRRIAQMEILRGQEVKTIDENATQQSVAQVNINDSGHNTVTLTQTPSQGTSARQRIGDSIALDKIVINGTFYKQRAAGSAINLTHYFVSWRGNEPDVVIADLFDGNIALDALNAGVQIYDTNVVRNPSYLQTIKIVATWKTHLPATVALVAGTQVFPHATSQHVVDLKGVSKEFDGLSGASSNLKYTIITVADAGNRGGTDSVLNGISMPIASTGILFNWGIRTFFRDA